MAIVLCALPSAVWTQRGQTSNQTSGQAELRIGYHTGITEPYAIIGDKELTGGLIKDIGDYIAKDLGLRVRYVNTPAARIEFQVQAGALNVRPFMSPVWTNVAEQYNWSVPLLVEQKAFLIRKSSPFRIRGFNDIRGLRIGTILGFQYPELDSLRGSFIRDDVETLRQNIERLGAGRIDAVYDSELYMLYVLKDSPAAPFTIEPFRTAPVQMSWAVAKNSDLPFDKINESLRRMVQDKVIERMAAKYRR